MCACVYLLCSLSLSLSLLLFCYNLIFISHTKGVWEGVKRGIAGSGKIESEREKGGMERE